MNSAFATIVAFRVPQEIPLTAQNPAPEWANAPAITFCADWQGLNPDPARQTEVRAPLDPRAASICVSFAVIANYSSLMIPIQTVAGTISGIAT